MQCVQKGSQKVTVPNPKGSLEKLSPNESPEVTQTVLMGAAPKDSVSIRGTSWGDSFFSHCPEDL